MRQNCWAEAPFAQHSGENSWWCMSSFSRWIRPHSRVKSHTSGRTTWRIRPCTIGQGNVMRDECPAFAKARLCPLDPGIRDRIHNPLRLYLICRDLRRERVLSSRARSASAPGYRSRSWFRRAARLRCFRPISSHRLGSRSESSASPPRSRRTRCSLRPDHLRFQAWHRPERRSGGTARPPRQTKRPGFRGTAARRQDHQGTGRPQAAPPRSWRNGNRRVRDRRRR